MEQNINTDDELDSDIIELTSHFESESYKKLNMLKKLEQYRMMGCILDKNYTMVDSLDELTFAYEFQKEFIKQKDVMTSVKSIKDSIQPLSDENMNMMTLMYQASCISHICKEGVLKYILEHDKNIWDIMTGNVYLFLKSEILYSLIESGYNWIKENYKNDTTQIYVNKMKGQVLIMSDEDISRIKKQVMERNYKLIQSIKDDLDIEHENRHEIIAMLIKINAIISDIKETSEDLVEMLNNLTSSDENFLEYLDTWKTFVVTNLKCSVKHNVFYNKYIAEEIKNNILKIKNNHIGTTNL
jgi:hypothetical protein